MADEQQKKWALVHGIHRHTITSRDSDSTGGLESLEACRAKLAENERFYKSIGYVIWYAYAVAPDGTQHTIHPGNSNYR